ncbi:MAG: peptide chain release factor 2 [Oscillospiraceae bacterium]|nr:peptide chain release factor 2 [Oscillospiraceae bacterium]
MQEAKKELGDIISQIKQLGENIRIRDVEREHKEYSEKINSDGFWDNITDANSILKKSKILSGKIKDFRNVETAADSAFELASMAISENDESLTQDILRETSRIKKDFSALELGILLDGEYDLNNAIISIHPGAGGTEAQDWAEMLYRMYMRYAEKHSFKIKTLDYLEGDGAGIKSVTFSVSGSNAFGYLKSENGVHRLVRISPFNAAGKRMTSFASVEVIPEIDDEAYTKIEIKPEDLRIESHRASGAGGQHVNKTDSAVRVIHIPTGITVGCQSERSQNQNRETAIKMLKSRLLEIKEREHLERIDDIKGEKSNIEWGHQIRSYVFMPYTLVTDKRTGYENGNVSAVMDGDLDGFIKAYLTFLFAEKEK